MKTKPKHKAKIAKPQFPGVLEAPSDAQAKLLSQIRPLAAELQRLQQQMKAAGILPGAVGLPTLQIIGGCRCLRWLITYLRNAPGVVIGLSFVRVDEQQDRWLCPACGKKFEQS